MINKDNHTDEKTTAINKINTLITHFLKVSNAISTHGELDLECYSLRCEFLGLTSKSSCRREGRMRLAGETHVHGASCRDWSRTCR